MSDLMLTAVLSMPYDMAMANDLSRRQFYDRAQQALEEINRLRAALKRANDQAEHFERKWYLRGDENEKLRDALVAALPVVQNERVRLAYNCEHAGAPSVIEGYRFLIATLDAVIAQADAALGADR